MIRSNQRIGLLLLVGLSLTLLNAQDAHLSEGQKVVKRIEEAKENEKKAIAKARADRLAQIEEVKAEPVRPATDIKTLIANMLDGGLAKPKGEFETTSEYKKHRANIGEKYTGLIRSFIVPGAASYDADSGEVAFKVWRSAEESWMPEYIVWGAEWGSDPDAFLVIRDAIRTSGSYAATNAFGARTTVTKTVHTYWGLAISPLSPMKREFGNYSGRVFTFPMDIADAKKNLPFLRIVVVGYIPYPEVNVGTSHEDATISVPFSKNNHFFAIPFVMDKLAVIDVRTGRVVVSFLPEL